MSMDFTERSRFSGTITLFMIVGFALLGGCSSDVDTGGGGNECFQDGKSYPIGASFAVGCNTCACTEEGSVICTAEACAVCEQDGQSYTAGESFAAGDGCNICQCAASGEISCTGTACATSCVYVGVQRSAGTSFDSIDGCNTCSCESDGSVSCTEIACACDPTKEWWRSYSETDQAACAIAPSCASPTTAFSNTCGCGCEQPTTCAATYTCTPPNVCDVAQLKKDCPYSEIIES